MEKNKYVKAEDVQNRLKELCKQYNISYGGDIGGFGKELALLTENLPCIIVEDEKEVSGTGC